MRFALLLAVIAFPIVPPALAQASVQAFCTHVTKSTLMQQPLAQPAFLPSDSASLDMTASGDAHLTVGREKLVVHARFCARSSNSDCTPPRAIAGDVLTIYGTSDALQKSPMFAIWHRKGAKPEHLIENVVLRCCTAEKDC